MKKILVVDDDQFFGKTLEAALPQGKYEMLMAEDGEQGLEMVKKDKPDLVILDLMMPKLDGTAFLKRMQEAGDEMPKPPVLVSSNLSSVKKISDCLALGAIGYVIKSEESMTSIVQDIERVIGEQKQ
jgi:phosphoserine phosphatase RsbU/P